MPTPIISTPDLCDAHPELVRVVEPMFINYGGREQFGGEIVTIKCFEDNSLVREFVAQPGTGKVLVVDAGGSMRRACLGDMLAEKATDNGWEGILMYGCIRDVDAISGLELGVQALGSHPMKTEKKGIGERNIAVTFGGVTFKPGEYLYADNNGVIVSPQLLM
ncbi:ribonuclease E activity regulator RraA [Microbulbifer hydrolyticus]|uniref:4-hydroxy-4-methyl-2-oxoglutarate aldolase n=1 Tax=Microbulbifer hydrolyticus TaxID=48074 RepID=A0A6P1TBZ5_9GAMM|nr:ribonuclease E activity regulator RraA [Microbulbifer hydrolyticus]MBB5210353.1 regulator of ribonuclease activity A [Microbulbifer hydrolyticus]QHQ39156.1 putative 4-hydroxy-4-methyl-2-oxoglutarate aldolase [Microbulbifer hydrolyticus]